MLRVLLLHWDYVFFSTSISPLLATKRGANSSLTFPSAPPLHFYSPRLFPARSLFYSPTLIWVYYRRDCPPFFFFFPSIFLLPSPWFEFFSMYQPLGHLDRFFLHPAPHQSSTNLSSCSDLALALFVPVTPFILFPPPPLLSLVVFSENISL